MQVPRESVEYLCHIIDKNGLHAAQSRVWARVEAHILTCVKKLRSSLGLLKYYGRFIKNLASVIHPLNSLYKQNSKWVWSPECAQAFRKAKDHNHTIITVRHTLIIIIPI